jgi:hypothetical protein
MVEYSDWKLPVEKRPLAEATKLAVVLMSWRKFF